MCMWFSICMCVRVCVYMCVFQRIYERTGPYMYVRLCLHVSVYTNYIVSIIILILFFVISLY